MPKKKLIFYKKKYADISKVTRALVQKGKRYIFWNYICVCTYAPNLKLTCFRTPKKPDQGWATTFLQKVAFFFEFAQFFKTGFIQNFSTFFCSMKIFQKICLILLKRFQANTHTKTVSRILKSSCITIRIIYKHGNRKQKFK